MPPCSLFICLAMAAVAGPQPSGWTSYGVIESTPYLSFVEDNRPRLTLRCDGTRTKVDLRGFKPAQSWPQPILNISFGSVKHASSPDLAMVADQTVYSLEFATSRKILMKLEAGERITASYQRQVIAYPAIRKTLRMQFARNCAGLLPQGWAD